MTTETTSHLPNSSATESQSAQLVEMELIEVRKTFAPLFKAMILSIMAFVILTFVGMFYIAVSPNVTPTAAEKALIVQLIQVGYGMFLGIVCVFLGVIMSWLGITSAFGMSSAAESPAAKGQLSLRGSGPGLVLLAGGIILIAVSLFKPIRYSETIPANDVRLQNAPPTD